MTLKPAATSMLSLFWVVFAVLAQLTNSAAQPAAVLLRKRRAVGFIDSDLPLVQNPSNFCNELLRLKIFFLPWYQLRGCHPAVLQSVPQPPRCERKQLPNLSRRLRLDDARHWRGSRSTAVPTRR